LQGQPKKKLSRTPGKSLMNINQNMNSKTKLAELSRGSLLNQEAPVESKGMQTKYGTLSGEKNEREQSKESKKTWNRLSA